ncbi:MAG: type II toxin-antitoxin system Phd/YefM family antitoxin [Lachnospiraceae bacterium]|nr:type II toxin-antitoxin system Phd/YefM family antitoxin [Lachnospiraceae bacterium]
MPSILPISDLRNYTEVLKEVDNSKRVYLTRNGHGVYAIITMAEADEYDRLKAAQALAQDLKRAEERAQKEGWTDADAFDREMGVIE